jgi:hypothetical protein
MEATDVARNNKRVLGRLPGNPWFCICGATVRDRTADLSITNALLYQLSYGGANSVSLLRL